MIRVALVDDHPVVRMGYRQLVEQTGHISVVLEAGNAEGAYPLLLQVQPDVCVTDLSMPGSGGLALLRKMVARQHAGHSACKMLVFSMHDSAPLVQQAQSGGAHGFVSKQAEPQDLIEAIRVVHRGGTYFGTEVSGTGSASPGETDETANLASLSPREFEIFRLLAQGLSPGECASHLCLSPKTVANHQTLIKEKLGVSTSAALVHLAMRNGVIASHE